LLITALGTRADANAASGLYARSLALVWLLKQYAHAISEHTKRSGYVDMDAANRPDVIAVLRQLGLREKLALREHRWPALLEEALDLLPHMLCVFRRALLGTADEISGHLPQGALTVDGRQAHDLPGGNPLVAVAHPLANEIVPPRERLGASQRVSVGFGVFAPSPAKPAFLQAFRPVRKAGDRGIEPRAGVLETPMLPLHQSPKTPDLQAILVLQGTLAGCPASNSAQVVRGEMSGTRPTLRLSGYS
jgi:hypothetical protein